MSREPWNSPQVLTAGGKREGLSLLVSLLLIRKECFPHSSAKPPPQASSLVTGQSWVTCLPLVPGREERLQDDFKPIMTHFLELGTLTLWGTKLRFC